MVQAGRKQKPAAPADDADGAVAVKKPWRSKTMWLATVTAGLGAIETAAPGVIPAGPTLMAISVLSAMLRVMTTQAIR